MFPWLSWWFSLGVSRGSCGVLRFSVSLGFLLSPRLLGGPVRPRLWSVGCGRVRGWRGSSCSFRGSWGSGLSGFCFLRWSSGCCLGSPVGCLCPGCRGLRRRCWVRWFRLVWLPSLCLALGLSLSLLLRGGVRLLGLARFRGRSRSPRCGLPVWLGLRPRLLSPPLSPRAPVAVLVGWLLGSCRLLRSVGWWLALVSSGRFCRSGCSLLVRSFLGFGGFGLAVGASHLSRGFGVGSALTASLFFLGLPPRSRSGFIGFRAVSGLAWVARRSSP